MFSFRDMKKALYILQTVMGVLLIALSLFLLGNCAHATEPVCYIVPAVVLMVVGVGCVFFGCETLLLRDDPDIWR